MKPLDPCATSSDRTARRNPTARLLLPRASMSGLLFAAIVRDTRAERLRADERYNCFPASPLCAVTWIFEGQLHLVDEAGAIDPVPLPRIHVSGPCPRPLVSWSAGPILAMSLGIYPDAWSALTGTDAAKSMDRHVSLEVALSAELFRIFRHVLEIGDCRDGLAVLQDQLEPLWRKARPKNDIASRRIGDWTRALVARAAVSGLGKSPRQIQRRIRAWTGQTRRQLRLHARVETLFARTRAARSGLDLAKIAAEAGYSDQSHMGREVRRITGESPARINRLIQTEERYWCYRLLGEGL
jgi:AraC-like DNA-binding protein